MAEIKPIGGFFELETAERKSEYHKGALGLVNGRACMSLILDVEKPSRVYVPYYTCYALYEPMLLKGIEYVFYSIDENLDPVDLPIPAKGELLVVINYYGLKDGFINDLSSRLGKKLIIDNTHSFFDKTHYGSYSFTSARKYFGIPDGAYLYGLEKDIGKIKRNTNISINHNVNRLLGFQEQAYKEYLAYEKSFGCDVMRMSLLSERILSSIDYEHVANIRNNNFNYVHEALGEYNTLNLDVKNKSIPFCYPFMPTKNLDREYLYRNKIYIPTLWPDVLERSEKGFGVEMRLVKQLMPLPIDHRYDYKDIDRMIKVIQEGLLK